MTMHRGFAAVVSFLFLTTTLAAQPMMMRGGQRLDERLKLSGEQRTKMEKLRTDHMKSMIDHRSKMATARVELRSLLKAEKVDRGAVEKKMKELADLGVKGVMSRLDHWSSVNDILTADQQKVWKEFKDRRMQGTNMRGFRGRGMMRGRGEMRMHDGPGMMDRDDD